jgi:cell division protein FtsB
VRRLLWIRPLRRGRLGRLVGLAVIAAIAFAYVQPIRAYMAAQDDIEAHRAQRSALLRQQAALRHDLAQVETDAFVEREARRIGLVHPGETLYVVQGVQKWKRLASGR